MQRVFVNRILVLSLMVFIVASCCKRVTPGTHDKPETNRTSVSENTILWKEVDPSAVTVQGRQIPLPKQFKVFLLNTATMKELLAGTLNVNPKERKSQNIELPYPEGHCNTFSIYETPSVSPALLEKYPHLRTYGGKGIQDPTATAKLDFMPGGFHAYIITEKGSVIIHPYSEGDTSNYICYYKNNSNEEKQPFEIPADSIK